MKDFGELGGLGDLGKLLSQFENFDKSAGGDKKVSPADLRKVYEQFSVKHKFAPGMLVTWKKGLRNKQYPEEGVCAIVVEVHDKPFTGDAESGSPYFKEPLDLALGVMLEGTFAIFHYDSRRFEPYD